MIHLVLNFTQERDYAYIQIGCDCDDYETLKEHILYFDSKFPKYRNF